MSSAPLIYIGVAVDDLDPEEPKGVRASAATRPSYSRTI